MSSLTNASATCSSAHLAVIASHASDVTFFRPQTCSRLKGQINMQGRDYAHDVVVVGGGVAGLATASLLARRGKRVILLEQARSLGGRAQTKQQDGFYLNIGPHA